MADEEPLATAYVVTLTVCSSEQSSILHAVEVMGRATAGLGLDGIPATLNVGLLEAFPDDDD
jgi:hypothetical protein